MPRLDDITQFIRELDASYSVYDSGSSGEQKWVVADDECDIARFRRIADADQFVEDRQIERLKEFINRK